ncbi:hypothetical protein DBT_0980 [Dissulfuribacter thermophilus]|uniref:Microcin J25-processing protein McjB C-terminal domain-containing protein n=1 Tax=Dissulfuribacter thermophilus TaxID=1156395 RepID=A0A1B9F6R2_9BACT|nr:lasso peptide biosynthesis B2 protein [Dissulfuribacter thermophilus]OCC15629.1 hypothetical protein DBT_0980 [Dissulfuribacter thermophilus]
MGKLSRFICLEPLEKRLFFLSLGWILFTRFALTIFPFKKTLALVESQAKKYLKNPKATSGEISVARLAWLISRAAHIVPGSTCLVQALAGKIIFASQGINPKFHIGVNMQEKHDLEAHAWLTLDGEVILGQMPNLSKFKPLSGASLLDI